MRAHREIIDSPKNPKVKFVTRLRKRSFRDEQALLLIEGYRELNRALENHYRPVQVFFCPGLFLGVNEPALLDACVRAGAALFECGEDAFRKMAYRDRPDGLLAVGPQIRLGLADLELGARPLVVVAEHIEKPGNLGTILRSADGVNADAVIVCDRCTDLNNPNVVRASVGTLFSRPVVEASSEDTLAFLAKRGIHIVAATPRAEQDYTAVDFRAPTAIVVGAEQVGLSDRWIRADHTAVRIPMLGQCDSLNVGTAAAILLYEALRQRKGESGVESG